MAEFHIGPGGNWPGKGGNERKKDNVSVGLDETKIQYRMFIAGNIRNGFPELIKVWAVIKQINEKQLSAQSQIEETAADLFNELGIKFFRYEDVFTPDVIKQITEAKSLKDISVKINDRLVHITTGSTSESIFKEWEDNEPKKDPKEEEAKLQKQEAEKQEWQEKCDAAIKKLDTLDFKNINAVMDWLLEFRYPGSWVDLTPEVQNIVKKFTDNGFELDDDYQSTYTIDNELGVYNKEESGRKLVSGFLAQLEHNNFVHPSWDDLIKQWQKS